MWYFIFTNSVHLSRLSGLRGREVNFIFLFLRIFSRKEIRRDQYFCNRIFIPAIFPRQISFLSIFLVYFLRNSHKNSKKSSDQELMLSRIGLIFHHGCRTRPSSLIYTKEYRIIVYLSIKSENLDLYTRNKLAYIFCWSILPTPQVQVIA